MSKQVDDNGFWLIKHNPISKVGVFPYLGSQISADCIPDKVYYVFRSPETLMKSVPTWDNPPIPFINDHQMLGNGFAKIDDRPVQGIIYNPVFENDTLYADLAIYSEDMKEQIENGKKEISLGYFCTYEKEPGIYQGQTYDYVQKEMVGNHGALVDAGRCGSSVRVFDSKCAMDALDIKSPKFEYNAPSLNTKQENAIINTETIQPEKGMDTMEKVDKREAIRKIMAIAAKPDSDFEGGETEKIDTIAKLLEKSEYAESKRGTANDEEEEEPTKIAKDKCGKDEDVDKRKFIREIMAIAAKPASEFEGGDKEKVETIAKLLEKSEYNKSERGTANDDSMPEILAYLKNISDKLDKVLSARVMDEDDDEPEKKKAEDKAFVFKNDRVSTAEDEALMEYLK